MKVESTEIEEIFLKNEDTQWSEDKLKKRGQNNSYTYQRKYRSKQDEKGDYSQEIRKPLTSLQYVMLRESHIDPNYKPSSRVRQHFVHKEHSYSIDIYDDIYGQEKTYILRFDNPENIPMEQIMPEWVKVVKDVKLDPKYSLRNIAKA